MALFSARNCLKKRCGGISDTWQNLAETGFNYLQSSDGNPEIGRFISSDVYLSTGQGVLGHNAYAYCLNNPVNGSDPSGHSMVLTKENHWQTIAEGCAGYLPNPINLALNKIGTDTVIDVVLWLLTLLTIISEVQVETDVKTDTKEESVTYIYRYGGTNPGNLTPKAKDKYTGLSFSTVPMPGAARTTIEELNATGYVYAIRDGITHVSVIPIGGTIEDWINAGSNSVWTQAVKSVVRKWIGGN